MNEISRGMDSKKTGLIFASAIMAALIIVNTVLIFIMFDLISARYPGEETRLGYKQAVAKDILEHNRRFAQDLGVEDNSSVKEALAGFNYEIEISSSSDDLTYLILNQGRRVQEIILREWEIELQEQVLAVINQDQNVKEVNSAVRLSLLIEEEDLTVSPDDLLQEETVERIREIYMTGNPGRSQEIEIEIREGEGRLSVPYNPVEHIKSLNEEIDDLRLTLRELRVETGFAEMRGEGVVVKLSDREGAVSSEAIIHDTDVRDVVNELYAAGAKGVSVGGHRLTATSAIRCVGPSITVNGQMISVPVEIKVVGDPEVLYSGLQIIKNNWEINRGIGFEIEKREEIRLPAY